MLIAMAALVSAACNTTDPIDDGETLEINASNLQGTWEVDIAQDFAQGYHRKYRVAFDSEKYTLWKMYQELLKVNDEYVLCDVGDKYEGAWAYAGGSLTLTPSSWWTSYQLVYDDYTTGKTHAEVNSYNVETMEASPWIDCSNMASGLDPDVWTRLALTKDKLSARINMDSCIFQKIK